MVRVRYSASGKNIDFITFVAPDVPAVASGDSGRFRQILLNLAGNAIKFTEKGAVAITGELIERSGDEIMPRFEIRDTGIGISEEASLEKSRMSLMTVSRAWPEWRIDSTY